MTHNLYIITIYLTWRVSLLIMTEIPYCRREAKWQNNKTDTITMIET
jgi:hypothetical protein